MPRAARPLPPPSPRPRRARRCCAPATKWRTAAAASPPPPCRPPPRRGEGVEPAALIGAAAAPAPLRPRTAPLGSARLRGAAPAGLKRGGTVRPVGCGGQLQSAPGLRGALRRRPGSARCREAAPPRSRPAPQAGAEPRGGGAGLSAALRALPLRARLSYRAVGDRTRGVQGAARNHREGTHRFTCRSSGAARGVGVKGLS